MTFFVLGRMAKIGSWIPVRHALANRAKYAAQCLNVRRWIFLVRQIPSWSIRRVNAVRDVSNVSLVMLSHFTRLVYAFKTLKLLILPGDGVCTVFGDPHYRTFDGKFYSFKGACKYQLVTDCFYHTFSIRVTNDARKTMFSAWTKTIAIKVGALNYTQKISIFKIVTRDGFKQRFLELNRIKLIFKESYKKVIQSIIILLKFYRIISYHLYNIIYSNNIIVFKTGASNVL